MDTQHRRIDPELVAVLNALPKTPYGPIDLSDLAAARKTAREMTLQATSQAVDDPSISIETLQLNRPDGTSLSVRMFRPVDRTDSLPCLVWFFGGGQILGAADEDDPHLKSLSSRLGCVVAAVDYRLAPEFPAPAAAEDGYLAYTHLRDQAAELGLADNRVGIAAVSGGGAIACAATLMIRDRGAQMPRLLALKYPMLDDRGQTPSSREFTDIGIYDRDANQLAWNAALAGKAGADDITAYQAPARAKDLSAFPPTFIGVGEIDVFRDEDIAFALQLVADRVPVELHLYPGAYHGWETFAPDSSIGRSFVEAWYGFLSRNLLR
jgi:acetyl esterase/lipase